jgi:protein-S-isoprenylcysteine O-methyltransferase Ste14
LGRYDHPGAVMGIAEMMRGSVQPSRGIRLWAAKNAVYLVIATVALIAVSGRVTWAAAWAYLAFLTAYLAVLGTSLYRQHSDLLVERSGVQEGSEAWDVPLASLSAVWLPLALYVVAALDQRFGWSPRVNIVVVAAAVILLLAGAGLSAWAMLVNNYFSAVVRLQTDRGQVVVSSGPYRLVRHPGYLGSLLLYTGVALVLGSLWALIIVMIFAAVLILRTVREDRFLHQRLPGYCEYASRVRFRLIPGAW